jgi:uncharacterized Zn finger protein (UPF0148 family)
MTDPDETLAFACPHCGGPLHMVEDGGVECKREHRFTVSEVLHEQARTSSAATWEAVNALHQRAQTARWAARDPDLYKLGDAESLEASAVRDDQAAEVLQHQAQMLDLTLWRLDQLTEQAPGGGDTRP